MKKGLFFASICLFASCLCISFGEVHGASLRTETQLLMRGYHLPSGTEPMLHQAILRLMRRTRGSLGRTTSTQLAREIRRIRQQPSLVTDLVPYLVDAGFKAIKARKRTKAQNLFVAKFARYFAKHERRIAKATLIHWELFKKDFERRVKEKSRKTSKTLSALIKSGPSLADFKPPDNLMSVGKRGRQATLRVLTPQLHFEKTGKPHPTLGPSEMGHVLGWIGLGSQAGFTVLLYALAPKLALTFSAAITAKIGGGTALATSAMATTIGGVFAVTGIALLVAAPSLLAAVMQIKDVFETKHFEERLKKQVNSKLQIPDLRRMLFGGRELSASLCYRWCRQGYRGVGPVCWQQCPATYVDDGATCRRPAHNIAKKSYTRRTYPLGQCRGRQRQGALCYPWCRKGYKGVGPVCWQQCPRGYRNDGATCRRTIHIFSKRSYGRGGGKMGKKCIKADLRNSNRVSALTYMLKMMVGDPADRGILFGYPTRHTRTKKQAGKKRFVHQGIKGRVGQVCLPGRRCYPGGWCHRRYNRCYQQCYGTRLRGGNHIPRTRRYWCHYGREKPWIQTKRIQRSKIGRPCPCGVGTWCNRRNGRCYETCYSTPTRGGNKIPRTRYYWCNYGRERPYQSFR